MGHHKEYDFYIVGYENEKRITLKMEPLMPNCNEINLDFVDFDSFSDFVNKLNSGRDKARNFIKERFGESQKHPSL